jgi:hypothetical protein
LKPYLCIRLFDRLLSYGRNLMRLSSVDRLTNVIAEVNAAWRVAVAWVSYALIHVSIFVNGL